MELMVVVVLVSLLAVLASPSFSEARNDRIAFDHARRFQQVLVQARARAAGTGSAHLALIAKGSGDRGFVRLYQALDGVAAASGGPSPVTSCRANPSQWDDALIPPPPVESNVARFIDFAEVKAAGVNNDMHLRADFFVGSFSANGSGGTTSTNAIAICITPAGYHYVGSGDSATAAIAAMRVAAPFNGMAEVQIQRHTSADDAAPGIGLLRRLIITGGSPARLRSE